MKSTAVSFLKRQSFRVKWNVRQIHKVTEWKSGCVYRTRTLGFLVCTPEYAMDLRVANKAIQVGPLSTSITRELL